MAREQNFIVCLYKGKGYSLERGNYRGLKLTEHVMKVLDRIVDGLIRSLVSIDDSQFGFVPGRGTTNAIFVVRQLQEEYLAANKRLYMAFVESSLNRSRIVSGDFERSNGGERTNSKGKTRIMICGTSLDLLQSWVSMRHLSHWSGEQQHLLQRLQALGAQEMQWAQALDKGLWLQMYTVPGNCTHLGR